jgi:hypothetical protein
MTTLPATLSTPISCDTFQQGHCTARPTAEEVVYSRGTGSPLLPLLQHKARLIQSTTSLYQHRQAASFFCCEA